MRRTMEIQLRRVEGAVIRTVRLIERRGFSVASITVRPTTNTDEIRMYVDLEDNRRSLPALALQIRSLTDVSAVSLSNGGMSRGRIETGHKLSVVNGSAAADLMEYKCR